MVEDRKWHANNLQLEFYIFQSSSAAMMIIDTEFKIVNINPAFTAITGFCVTEIENKRLKKVFDLFVNYELETEIVSEVNDKGFWRGELDICSKYQNNFTAVVLIDSIKIENTPLENCGFVVIFLDITEHQQREDELRYHAEIDPLTRLANRKLFFQQFDNAIALAKRSDDNVAILYLDLDGFKQVNDRLGHGIGDEILIEVAKRLKQCVRESDTVARLGGDEFVIILNRTSKLLVHETAQRIIDSLTITVNEKGLELNISSSIGIAIYPDDSENPLMLLKFADAAMYCAKKKGKHQYCWHVD